MHHKKRCRHISHFFTHTSHKIHVFGGFRILRMQRFRCMLKTILLSPYELRCEILLFIVFFSSLFISLLKRFVALFAGILDDIF